MTMIMKKCVLDVIRSTHDQIQQGQAQVNLADYIRKL